MKNQDIEIDHYNLLAIELLEELGYGTPTQELINIVEQKIRQLPLASKKSKS